MTKLGDNRQSGHDRNGAYSNAYLNTGIGLEPMRLEYKL